MSSPPVDDSDALHLLPASVLEKAAREGRMRGIALEAWAEARREPRRAGRVLRDGIREARALHSRERRLVREALYGMVRGHVRWSYLLGTDEPLVLWLAQLVECGLPVEVAREEAGAPYERIGAADTLLGALPPVPALATRHGLPASVVGSLVATMGEEGARAFLAASDRRAPVTLRAVGPRDQLARRLKTEGIDTVPGELAATALHVVGRGNLQGSRAFREGAFEVQDEGSQCMAALVPAVDRVWDVCAGSGGKALALVAQGRRVLATDVRGGALTEARRRAERARVRLRTEVMAPEGELPDAVTAFRPQAVLVDAPCSGTGVLRRHPEHRWLLDEEALQRLPAVQGAILDRVAPQVPEGGALIYGTCSVLHEENDAVVDAFLARHPAFQRDGDPLRLLPHEGGTDGFFAQRLVRVAEGSHPLHSTSLDAAR